MIYNAPVAASLQMHLFFNSSASSASLFRSFGTHGVFQLTFRCWGLRQISYLLPKSVSFHFTIIRILLDMSGCELKRLVAVLYIPTD